MLFFVCANNERYASRPWGRACAHAAARRAGPLRESEGGVKIEHVAASNNTLSTMVAAVRPAGPAALDVASQPEGYTIARAFGVLPGAAARVPKGAHHYFLQIPIVNSTRPFPWC